MSERRESKVPIFDRSAQDYVDATFIDGVTWEEVADTQSVWKPAMKDLLEKLELASVPEDKWPEHKHWDWRLKFLMGTVEGLRFFGVHHELLMQGMMIVKPEAKSKLSPKAKLVYVEYVASAPWNLSIPQVQRGRFGQVGRVLLAAAVQLSRESSFDGRVGLLALPQAVSWYQDLKMVEVPEADIDRLRYFELTPEQSREFLPEEGKWS